MNIDHLLAMPRPKRQKFWNRIWQRMGRKVDGAADRNDFDFDGWDKWRREQIAIRRFNEKDEK